MIPDFFLSRDSSGGGYQIGFQTWDPKKERTNERKQQRKKDTKDPQILIETRVGYVVDLPHPAILSNTLHQT